MTREIFRSIVRGGLALDVYPSRPSSAYAELASEPAGLRLHATLPLRQLLAELTEYDFGWAGFNAALNGAHLDTCLLNKAHEYVGCGLPVLTLRHRALSSRRRGLLRREPHDARRPRGQLAAIDVEVRRRIASARFELTVEANIHRLIELYESVS